MSTSDGAGLRLSMGGGDADYGSGGPGGGRRKRRRPRPPHAKPARPHEPHRGGAAARLDVASRERVFQSVEGLLRQIREQAEDGVQWSEAELREITQTVTAFTKLLEQEGDPISDRAHTEYQRIREKLNQALNRAGQAARESAGGF
jgi:hypothetical protein